MPKHTKKEKMDKHAKELKDMLKMDKKAKPRGKVKMGKPKRVKK